MSQLLNQERILPPPTEMMLIKPRQVLCDLVGNYTLMKSGKNYQDKIQELASAPDRWLSIAYPISEVDTNSPEARDRILSGLAIMCYLNELEEELGTEVTFDFQKILNGIDYYFEVTQCPPFTEERPQILTNNPVFYEPGINHDVVTALIYPKEELIERLAKLSGLIMEENVLTQIPHPVLMDGKQDQKTIVYKCTHDYQKPIIYEMIGTIIALTLTNSEQEFEFPTAETCEQWADQLISMPAETTPFDIVVNASKRVFWLPDPADFR